MHTNVGAANAIGLVPMAAFLDRVGTATGDVLVNDIPAEQHCPSVNCYFVSQTMPFQKL